jgi:PLD-like domain
VIALAQLQRSDLLSVAVAVRTGRISPPFSPNALSRIIGGSASADVSSALQQVFEAGCSVSALPIWLEILAEASSIRPRLEDLATLVMTGPVQTAVVHRDTRVVVADLFRRAESSVVIAGYAIHQGRRIFSDLAARMENLAVLNVRLYLNLAPKPGDNRDDSERISKSAREFVERHWPSNHRLPEIYYDRRGLRPSPEEPVSFHAKCIIRDRKELFISSANFTEAAQNRNIEMGVLLVSPALADQAFNFFADLVREGICVRAL